MFVRRNFLLLVSILAVAFALVMGATRYQRTAAAPTAPPPELPDAAFRQYWFAGKAELTSYDLQQVQYGQKNAGEAVLIFVTEDFRTDTQVKLESDPETTFDRSKATPVLKLNQVRKFVTGIYDYSVLTSVFMPLDLRLFPHALKATASVQEWCGHSYQQLNLRGKKYDITSHSYFEKEADAQTSIPRQWLEDELLTRIRLSPETLPTGEIEVVPSLLFARLKHQLPASQPANAALSDTLFEQVPVRAYTLDYPALGRRVVLFFEKQSPFGIVGWEETNREKNAPLTTRATRRRTLLTDYWNHHDPAGKALRDSLFSSPRRAAPQTPPLKPSTSQPSGG